MTSDLSPLTYPFVQSNPAAFADSRHPADKQRIAVNALGQHVAAFCVFFDQHPARVRRWTGFERQLPDHPVPFVHEVPQREPFEGTRAPGTR